MIVKMGGYFVVAGCGDGSSADCVAALGVTDCSRTGLGADLIGGTDFAFAWDADGRVVTRFLDAASAASFFFCSSGNC